MTKSLLSTILSTVVIGAMLISPIPVYASEPASTTETVDPTSRLEEQRATRVAELNADSRLAEAKTLDDLGRYQEAITAYEEALVLQETPDPKIEKRLAQLRGESRGTIGSEPESVHRVELDKRWAPPVVVPVEATSAAEVAAPSALPSPVDANAGLQKKWYFWATVAVLVASSAAVSAIAIKAKRDLQPDDLDAGPGRVPAQRPALIRF